MTFFIDLDGTIVDHGTNDLLPGAVDLLRRIRERGGRIVFVTRRSNEEFGEASCYSANSAVELLRSIGMQDAPLLYGYGSPRVLVDDGQAALIKHPANSPWTDEEIEAAFRSDK